MVQINPDPASAPPQDLLPADVALETILMVNVYFVGTPGSDDWVLVDAGLPLSASRVIARAKSLFGESKPKAILLTHGHFDHIGSLRALLAAWDVPVYAHELELPYLTGKSSYPPPDPTVGGMMARLSPLYPAGPFDFSDHIHPLPMDGSIPHLAEWRWLATPGHSPGHVSFYRDADGTLLAGDAFVTQEQESLLGVVTAKKVMHGPPMYFTPDWASARESVRMLANLGPSLALTGHGKPMADPELTDELAKLASRFNDIAIPPKGRYTKESAVTDETGVVSVPPPVEDQFNRYALMAAGAAALGLILWAGREKRRA